MADTTVIIGNSPVKIHDNLDGTYSATSVINAPIPTGANLMGKVGIDQTTPGVTNGVTIVGSLPNDGLTPTTGDVAQTPMLFNGATWDRQRGNTQATLLASATRTATATTATTKNYNARGIMLMLDVTAASGTGGLSVHLNASFPGAGVVAGINVAPPSIVAVGKYAYEIYPGSTAPGVAGSYNVNQRTSAILTPNWYVDVVHGDASSYTYALYYALIV